MKKTAGIHHITAIVGHPQENTDFYAGILGLRLVDEFYETMGSRLMLPEQYEKYRSHLKQT